MHCIANWRCNIITRFSFSLSLEILNNEVCRYYKYNPVEVCMWTGIPRYIHYFVHTFTPTWQQFRHVVHADRFLPSRSHEFFSYFGIPISSDYKGGIPPPYIFGKEKVRRIKDGGLKFLVLQSCHPFLFAHSFIHWEFFQYSRFATLHAYDVIHYLPEFYIIPLYYVHEYINISISKEFYL